MKRAWSKLGGQLGIGCIAIGLLVIGLAWNGAAGVDFAQGQIPYLLSGGALGIGLVILGATLVIVQNSRQDRALLEVQLADLNTAIARLASAIGAGGGNGHSATGEASPLVVVGRSSFHRPACRLAQGKDLPSVPLSTAVEEGLSPCRICHPAEAPERIG